ncbi:hypothetical protein [Algibacter pacificus]|uniref:hypothetical protein n=1 Tax=Algibacter pacificus TaxID=2599389 RepID=UPI0011CBCA86|nr:hypothetical protein [Algibacter pacificus]
MKAPFVKIVNTLVFICILASCSTNETEESIDPIINDETDETDEIIVEVVPDVILTVNAAEKTAIHPEIFGVNNDWKQVSNTSFPSFANTLNTIDYSIMRYPGGWESEFYEWDSNTTPSWNSAPENPGASVSSLKANVSNYSIVIPTAAAMDKVLGSEQFNTALQELKLTAEKAINYAGDQFGIVEIGNEWWLQWGGGVDRAAKLSKYTQIAMNLASHLDEKFPNRKFKLLVNGDYTKPEEFLTMKEQFTKAYQVIDGVALHTYTGYQTDTHNISDLESRINACANNFNAEKHYVYLSEWMPSRDYNNRALYMEAANIIPDIIQIYARANADAAAFWPPINSSIPGLGLTNWNYSTVFPVGQIFGELSRSFKGHVLKTTANKFHVAAALNDSETIVVFVTGGNQEAALAAIKIENFTITSIENVERFVPDDYLDTSKAASYKTEEATAEINKNNEVVFDINKEGKYQIYKIILKGY